MDKPVKQNHSNLNLYLATFAVNLATIASGCTMTWTSPTLPKLLVPNDKILITEGEGTWIGSLLPLGACFGPLLATLIVDKIGKKILLLACTLIIFLHWIIIAAHDSLEAILVARFIAGSAVGIIFNLVPVYIAEISSNETRGFTGSLFLLFLGIGFNIPYILGPYTSISTLIFVVASLPVCAMLLLIWIPESPHYLLDKGQKHKAYEALEWLRTYPNESVIQQEITDLQETLDKSHQEKLDAGSIILQVTNPRSLKSMYYGCALIFFQQMSGCNAVTFYGEKIFKSSSSISSSTATIICGLVMIGASILVPLVGKLFRIKSALYFSATGCTFFLIILGIYFKVKEVQGKVSECYSWVPIFCIVGYIISHSLGLGSYAWVILAEIFHPSIKTIASAFTVTFCWFLTFIVTKLFDTFINLLDSSGTFWLFGGFSFLALIFLIVQLPDTQGKSFQEIQDLIAGKKNNVDVEAK